MCPSDGILEHNQKIAARWEKAADFFFGAAESMTPIAQIPILNLVANPIMNGFWGLWHVSSAVAHKYDPHLKQKHNRTHSALKIANYVVGGIATVAGLMALIPPLWPIIPILLPVAAIATVTSSTLWVVGLGVSLYKELKNEPHEGHRWRIGQRASALLYGIGTLVVGSLILAAMFTPVGWVAGAGALTFAIAASATTLAVFGVSKFCQWRAHVAESKVPSVSAPIEKPTIKPEVPNPTAKQNSTPTQHKEILPEFTHEQQQKKEVMSELSEKLKDKNKKKKDDGDDDREQGGAHP